MVFPARADGPTGAAERGSDTRACVFEDRYHAEERAREQR